MPGETLPLRIGPPLAAHSSLRSAAIEQALAAPPPLSRLIAVVRVEASTLPRLLSSVPRSVHASVPWHLESCMQGRLNVKVLL